MNLTEELSSFYKGLEGGTRKSVTPISCALCWGYQEYDKKIRKRYADKQLDVNNHKAYFTPIRNFVVERINGIRLKKGKTEKCPTCGDGNGE